jgi:hypothetical protein
VKICVQTSRDLSSSAQLHKVRYKENQGRRPPGRPRRRWLDNIMMDLVDVGWGGVDWIGLAQDRDKWRALVNSTLSLRVP